MLPAYKGRINRKTFMLGNIIGLTVLGFASALYLVPLALIDIVVNVVGSDTIFKVLYALIVIPAIYFFFYFSVLFVKRLHDVGYPGMLILGAFTLLIAIAYFTDIGLLNLLAILIVLALAVIPGQKQRNHFGPVPSKKFKLDHLSIKF